MPRGADPPLRVRTKSPRSGGVRLLLAAENIEGRYPAEDAGKAPTRAWGSESGFYGVMGWVISCTPGQTQKPPPARAGRR